MDIQPTRNNLVANYIVTFAVVGLIFYLSSKPGKVSQYYYSPEYSSHSGYGQAVSCNQCHSSAWGEVTDKNCSTAGCHTQFVAGVPASADRLALTKDEFGTTRPHFGAILAFHDKVMGQVNCEVCHPSHRVPQKGAFNHETIVMAMAEMGGGATPGGAKEIEKKRADAFHRGAEKYTGRLACNMCHVDMNAAGERAAGNAVAAAEQMEKPQAEVPVPTPTREAQENKPAAASTTGAGVITTGNLLTMPSISETPGAAMMPSLPKSDAADAENRAGEKLPNLFEAAKQVEQSAPRDDSAVEMPN